MLVRMIHVSKYYLPGVPVLRDIDLTIGKGELVFLVGPSGAGKSTLLRLIYMADRPSEGQILVAGYSSATVQRREIACLRRKLGIVSQKVKLLWDRTVAENVALSLQVRGIGGRQAQRKTRQALQAAGLYQEQNRLPGQLSGGAQQRVALARAMINDPLLLIADEPTGNLDFAAATEMVDLLQEIKNRGTAVLMATHDLELVGRSSHRTIQIEKGRLV